MSLLERRGRGPKRARKTNKAKKLKLKERKECTSRKERMRSENSKISEKFLRQLAAAASLSLETQDSKCGDEHLHEVATIQIKEGLV